MSTLKILAGRPVVTNHAAAAELTGVPMSAVGNRVFSALDAVAAAGSFAEVPLAFALATRGEVAPLRTPGGRAYLAADRLYAPVIGPFGSCYVALPALLTRYDVGTWAYEGPQVTATRSAARRRALQAAKPSAPRAAVPVPMAAPPARAPSLARRLLAVFG